MNDTLAWLMSRQRFGIELGLERIRALLSTLGNPQEAFRSILVGGTNGKGSTANTLARVLHEASRATALFTSPHLTNFRERFVIDTTPLSNERIATALAEIRPEAERLEATFYEIVTSLGCVLFAQAEVEFGVFEVGLGGQYDATNALDPVVSIITGVALDHTDVLGSTIGEIAATKSGIMRPGRPLLTGAEDPALGVLRSEARKVGAELWSIGDDIVVKATSLGSAGISLGVESPLGQLELTSPLIGHHQARNVALAAVAGQILGADAPALRRGVEKATWPGRLEPLRVRDRVFLLDGAHNPQAAEVLAEALRDLGVSSATFLFGMSLEKDIVGIASRLEPLAREVVLTRAGLSPRAAPPEELRHHWRVPTTVAQTVPEAVEIAVQRSLPGECLVAVGSLYLIGELRPLLLGEERERFERWQ